MKISKVDNIHTAVNLNMVDSRINTGILYKHPCPSGQTVYGGYSLDKYIDGRIEATKALYNAFNSYDDKVKKFLSQDAPDRKDVDFPDNIKDIFADLAKYYTDTIISSFFKRKKEDFNPCYKKIQGTSIDGELKKLRDDLSKYRNDDVKISEIKGRIVFFDRLKENIDSLTNPQLELLIDVMSRHYLRKKLSRVVVRKDGFNIDFRILTKDLLRALVIIDRTTRDQAFTAIDKDAVLCYLKEFYKDYSKIKQGADIKKSIRNNNVQVQSRQIKEDAEIGVGSAIGNKPRFMLSNGGFEDNKSEQSKRAFIFSFMKEYASIGQAAKREKKLVEIKLLLVLFLYGGAAYSECQKDSTVAELDTRLKEKNGVFCQEALNEILGSDSRDESTDSKMDAAQIKAMLHTCFLQKYNECKSVLSIKHGCQDSPKKDWPHQMKEEMGWIVWFEDCIERILQVQKSHSKVQSYKLENTYLLRKCWAEFMAFICQKYIAIGKVVFHFCLPHYYDSMSEAASQDNTTLVPTVGDANDGKRVTETVSRENVAPASFELGIVPDALKKRGITGFDYEKIKAIETLQRETAAYIAVAAGNFIRSVADQQSLSGDLFTMKGAFNRLNEDELQTAYVRVMRYFGGYSFWKNWNPLENITAPSDVRQVQDFRRTLIEQLKASIYAIRNSSFHYAEGITKDIEPIKEPSLAIVRSMIVKEANDASQIIRAKYYSNNVWMFYKQDSITGLLKKLYEKETIIPAQIPSFHSIFTKEKLFETFSEWTYKGEEKERGKIWENTVYFLLKECYYRAFLPNPKIAKELIDTIDRLVPDPEARINNEKWAIDHFQKVLGVFKDSRGNNEFSAGDLCQFIMGEYNRQNNELQKVVSGGRSNSNSDKRGFQHLPMILHKTLRKTFKKYIEENITFKFIGEPYTYIPGNGSSSNDCPAPSLKQFCASWETNIYLILSEDDLLDNNPLLLHWFLAAHFLSPVQLNHLKGTLKSFIAFSNNITVRQEAAKGSLDIGNSIDIIGNKSKLNEDLLRILEIVSLYCGRTSGIISDYFPAQDEKTSEDVYAGFLENFVDFKNDKCETTYDALKDFCRKENGQKAPDGQAAQIGLYYDAESPIPNRNLVYADMYGNAGTIAECISPMQAVTEPISRQKTPKGKNVEKESSAPKSEKEETKEIPLGKVTYTELRDFYKLQKSLETVFNRGYWKTEAELRDQRQYICIKNRVELLDIAIYTDIMNDLFIHLVIWCNMWERDQMYLRLGFQYVKLFFTDSIDSEDYRRKLIVPEGPTFVDGAILYQIEAVYNYELPLYVRNTESVRPKEHLRQALSEELFKTGYCLEEKDAPDHVFDEGMEFFDNLRHLRHVKNRRNYIDHLNYYSRQRENQNYSMMELFAFMYNDMFRYSTNLRKSTTYVFENVLTRYRVLPKLTMERDEISLYSDISEVLNAAGASNGTDNMSRKRAIAVFKTSYDEKGLRSDIYTFKSSRSHSEEDDMEKDKNSSEESAKTDTRKEKTANSRKEKYTVNSRSDTFLRQLDALLVFKQQALK